MIKQLMVISVVLYTLVLGAYFVRFPISYRIAKVDPDVIKTRSLSFEEYNSLDKAEMIRKRISMVTLISSLILAIFSGVVWYFKLSDTAVLPKVMCIVSTIISLILILASSIGFIPGPPIR